jgi:uroporphyrin-III C-methyltransferase/precorrin-2 dehydrogenase/sirohydrochlorin ferrochelatase
MRASCAHGEETFATVGERRRFWEKFFVNDRLAQSLANQDQKAVEETTGKLLSEPLDHRGEVVLVGAGPGDAGLLTLKGCSRSSRRISWFTTVWSPMTS